MKTKSEIEKHLVVNKEYIMKTYKVLQLGIFGSYVRNEENNNSDIDILVKFKSGHKGFFNYMRLKIYLEEIFQNKVDLVMRDAIKSGLKERIFREVQYV